MPVINKIKDLQNKVIFNDKHGSELIKKIDEHLCLVDLKNTYFNTLLFIKWYDHDSKIF